MYYDELGYYYIHLVPCNNHLLKQTLFYEIMVKKENRPNVSDKKKSASNI